MLDTNSVREAFPFFKANPGVTYLDSAATSLKPTAVIDEVAWYLSRGTASVDRSVYELGVQASERVREARIRIARWFGTTEHQLVFAPNATTAINLVRFGLEGLRSVITTTAEHHSNFLPWQSIDDCRSISCDPSGLLRVDDLQRELQLRSTDIVAIHHVNNVTGAIQPVRQIADLARSHGALTLVDVAQSASHRPVNIEDLGADFFVCSGHKMLGPSGVGALIGKPEVLDRLQPVWLGGGVVESVAADRHELRGGPARLEPGTPPVESILGWARAIEYLESLGIENVQGHNSKLTEKVVSRLQEVPAVTIHGGHDLDRCGIVSFSLEGWEAHAAARTLSQRFHVCVRSGFHCAEPLHRSLQVGPTLRCSFHVYSNETDIRQLIAGLVSMSELSVG